MIESSALAALVASLVSIAFGWAGRRYLEHKVEEERSINAKELALVSAEYQKELEGLKSRLRLSEAYFNEQVEACTSIFALVQEWLPEQQRPDMDWTDALRIMTDTVGEIEQRSTALYTRYYAVLPEEVTRLLTQASAYANEAKFLDATHPSGEAIHGVELVYDNLRTASAKLKEALDGQIHSPTIPGVEQRIRQARPSTDGSGA